MYADLIAVEGDPIADIKTLQKTTFVMKGGKVIRNDVVGGTEARTITGAR